MWIKCNFRCAYLPVLKMAESVVEVVEKLQSRLSASAEPKKVRFGICTAVRVKAGRVRQDACSVRVWGIVWSGFVYMCTDDTLSDRGGARNTPAYGVLLLGNVRVVLHPYQCVGGPGALSLHGDPDPAICWRLTRHSFSDVPGEGWLTKVPSLNFINTHTHPLFRTTAIILWSPEVEDAGSSVRFLWVHVKCWGSFTP